jgi:hypothetical protein
MTVGSISPAAGPSQSFGVGNDRQNERSSVIVGRDEKKADPFRREDETSRPSVMEAQSGKRGDQKNRGGKIDFVV